RSYRDHRHLHSFPTRRSSDLIGGSAAAWNIGIMMLSTLAVSALTKPPAPGGGSADGTDGHWYQLTGTSNQANLWGVIPFVIGQQDRKSTRLNSSHVKISYAVF